MQTVKKLLSREVPVPEALLMVLEEAGIDMIFGIPGGRSQAIFTALYDHRDKIRPVTVRHESLAGVMAEAYGRLTGKPGVAMGQGLFMLSNALIGVLEAHLGCSPMLLLGDLSDNAPFSHHGPYQAGTGEYGTWDAKQSFSGITKMTVLPKDGIEAVQCLQLALKHSLAGERGPVAVLFHSHALDAKVGPQSTPQLYSTEPYLSAGKPSASLKDVQQATRLLTSAKKPVIIAGNGVRVGRAYQELQDLAEELVCPVATTAAGKGVFNECHALALGVAGNFGLPIANHCIAEADVVLVVGSKLSPTFTCRENPEFLDPQRQIIIQLDIEPTNASWSFPCHLALIGDARVLLNDLAGLSRESGWTKADDAARRKKDIARLKRDLGYFDFSESAGQEIPIRPQRIIEELNRSLDDDTIVTCDAGENRLFMIHYFQCRRAGCFLAPVATGGMGYAIPAGLTAKLLYPRKRVVAVCGDGGFSMSLPGLLTALDEDIPLTVIVFNNSHYGWVRHNQGDRPVCSQLGETNFAHIAKAMGCDGFRVEKPQQLRSALMKSLKSKKPAVIDVAITMDASFRDVTSPLVKR
ncbi:MAG: thiamine pyrophosphate-binding protein [Syntrophales bacterium]|jgi:acetolactate synthase-1/2/3 large subunit|nr:thiamine pyrophosphate-binding protein [Syntrophales bacterium]